MAYYYVPDPMPPQQPGQYPQPYPLPISPITKPPKPGKGLSYKRAKKISDDWLKILAEVEEAKKGKGHHEKKKRDGLNWVELSLCLIFVSIPMACLEVGVAIMLVHLLPLK